MLHHPQSLSPGQEQASHTQPGSGAQGSSLVIFHSGFLPRSGQALLALSPALFPVSLHSHPWWRLVCPGAGSDLPFASLQLYPTIIRQTGRIRAGGFFSASLQAGEEALSFSSQYPHIPPCAQRPGKSAVGAAWRSGPCRWAAEAQPEAWGREERRTLLPTTCLRLGLSGKGLPAVPLEPPVPFLAGLAPLFPLPGTHLGFKHPPEPPGTKAGAMEGVRHHSPLPASRLPLPQRPPPQNELHHMQCQQYPALVWDPCAQPAWSLAPSSGVREQVGGPGQVEELAVLWKGIPASPSHARPWWGGPRGDPAAAASHGHSLKPLPPLLVQGSPPPGAHTPPPCGCQPAAMGWPWGSRGCTTPKPQPCGLHANTTWGLSSQG